MYLAYMFAPLLIFLWHTVQLSSAKRSLTRELIDALSSVSEERSQVQI